MIGKYMRGLQLRIINDDCLNVLPTLESDSVDSIVTDPPYELGFMGKHWDNTGIAHNVKMWQECLRVLKPGGHLLAFGGTRTYHRMACAIEDAGFEIRDMIEWVYGCLSEDTEILTESGYKPLHKLTQYDRIGVYDITNNIYKWERPQRWSVYKVHQDTAYRIKSDYTDQIVSRNHRCLVEREGKLVFIQAEELNEVEYMPTLPEDFYSLQKNSNRKLLLKELLWKDKRLAQKVFSKWTGNKKSEERIEVRKEPSLERWSNLLEETRKLQADKICEVPEGVFTDGEKRWICNGTSFDSGSILGDMFRENPSSASYQSRPTGQPTGKSDVISIKQGTQITRRARVTKIEYSGIIFCPTVSTGAFIARRNDQVFITGNSGFPKSLNIGKAVDQLQGNERETIGTRNTHDIRCGLIDKKGRIGIQVTKGNSVWEGWGTALKPAHEPICFARKPLSEKTIVENVLKHGTGGINIDGCRIEGEGWHRTNKVNAGIATHKNKGWGMKQGGITGSQSGRFPANLIHDGSDEVKECFPETSSRQNKESDNRINANKTSYFIDGKRTPYNSYEDSGNASRYFKSIIYTSKASPSERLECNRHPTVKPIKLMEYLITMITPPNGVVLDPFLGSGTTAIACRNLGFDCIGIEKETEYMEIINVRLEHYGEPEPSLFEVKNDSNPS